jgi:HEAT repeat protein
MTQRAVSTGVRQKLSEAERLIKEIKAVPVTSKGPNDVLEQEIVLRKSFLSLQESTRYDIVNNLVSVDNDLSRQLLMNILLYDPSSLVRHEAAFALGWIGNETCAPMLRYALANDKSLLVRHEAAMALAEFSSKADIQSLESGLMDRSKEVSISCAVALQRIRERIRLQNKEATDKTATTRQI